MEFERQGGFAVNNLRGRGKWYALSFTYTATPDHMEVVAFRYTIGPEIPEANWAADGLWD